MVIIDVISSNLNDPLFISFGLEYLLERVIIIREGDVMRVYESTARSGGEVQRVPDSAVRSLRAVLKTQCAEEPLRRLEDAISDLNASAIRLRKSRSAVEHFKQKSVRRNDEGAIDTACLKAELVGAEVVAKLSASMLDLVKAAKRSKDVYAIHLVRIGCDMLSSHADSRGLLQQQLYPVDLPGLRTRLVTSRLSRAESAYSAIVESLGEAPQLLGKTLPTFKEISGSVSA